MPLNFVASTRSPGMRRLRASLLHILEKSTSDDLLCNTELKIVKFNDMYEYQESQTVKSSLVFDFRAVPYKF